MVLLCSLHTAGKQTPSSSTAHIPTTNPRRTVLCRKLQETLTSMTMLMPVRKQHHNLPILPLPQASWTAWRSIRQWTSSVLHSRARRSPGGGVGRWGCWQVGVLVGRLDRALVFRVFFSGPGMPGPCCTSTTAAWPHCLAVWLRRVQDCSGLPLSTYVNSQVMAEGLWVFSVVTHDLWAVHTHGRHTSLHHASDT
jgi:hypothetical protein